MRKYKYVLIAVFLMANLYAILSGGLYFFQENLIFHPSQLPPNYEFNFVNAFDEVNLSSKDGAKLNALHFKVDEPLGTVLYFHGNAGDLSRWGEIVLYFVQKDLNVIIMDYRSFGKSTGALSEKALYQDAEMWYAFAKAESQKSNTPLYIYGRSLGSTFATYTASKKDCDQLILESPFYSIEDEAKSRFPILPVRRLLKYRFPTHEYINNVTGPITIVHGTADQVVAYEHGKALYDSIKSAHKTFITVADGGHNDLVEFTEYHRAMESIFFKK